MTLNRTTGTFGEKEKKDLLLKWKESGLTLPQWRRENADELGLPHLSTLYAWAKEFDFSTEPGVQENKEPEEPAETPDETGDSDDSPDRDEPTETGQKADSDDNKNTETGGEEVIVKDRIEQLEPSTVPEPVQPEKAVEEQKTGIKTETLLIIGGAVVLGVGAYVLISKLRQPKQEPQPQQENNPMSGGNPFAGYTTIDDF